METYSILRQLADSWGLVFLFLVFISVIVFVYRPGSKNLHKEISKIPLKNENLLTKKFYEK
jgi:cytochrome c oxidase cbb3-type subunit 4|tara:strand:- start:156 stop:338 length:183 start_codon:yes stop_codon:yes gene_type:complete